MSFYYPTQERGVPNGKPGLYPSPAAVPGAPMVGSPSMLQSGLPAGYPAGSIRYAQPTSLAGQHLAGQPLTGQPLPGQPTHLRGPSTINTLPSHNSGLTQGLPHQSAGLAQGPGLSATNGLPSSGLAAAAGQNGLPSSGLAAHNGLAPAPQGPNAPSPYGIPISASPYAGYPSSSLGSYLAMSPVRVQQPPSGLGAPSGSVLPQSANAASYTGAPFISTSYPSSLPAHVPQPSAQSYYSSPNAPGMLGAYPSSYVSVNPMGAPSMSQYPSMSQQSYTSIPGYGLVQTAPKGGEVPGVGMGVAGPYPGAPSTARFIRPAYP